VNLRATSVGIKLSDKYAVQVGAAPGAVVSTLKAAAIRALV
jgi:hypothetical protein